MTEAEIRALVKGIAPIIKVHVADELEPLRQRLEQLDPADRLLARRQIAEDLLRRAER